MIAIKGLIKLVLKNSLKRQFICLLLEQGVVFSLIWSEKDAETNPFSITL